MYWAHKCIRSSFPAKSAMGMAACAPSTVRENGPRGDPKRFEIVALSAAASWATSEMPLGADDAVVSLRRYDASNGHLAGTWSAQHTATRAMTVPALGFVTSFGIAQC
jgi:hypothetical protein